MRNSLVLSLFSLLVAAAVVTAAIMAFVPSVSAADDLSELSASANSGLAVKIQTDGDVLVRGAMITATSSATTTATTTEGVFMAESSWGNTVITWTLMTDGDTNIIDMDGDTSTSTIDVDHEVSFAGSLDQDDGAFVVDVRTLKNLSVDDGDDDGPADQADAQEALLAADQALEDAEEAIDDARDDGRNVDEAEDLLAEAHHHHDLGHASFDEGDWDEAVEHAEEAIAFANDARDAAMDADDDDNDSISERISDRIQSIIDRLNDRLDEI